MIILSQIKEAIHTAYLGLKILGRITSLEEIIYELFTKLDRRLDKMDQATRDAINAVKQAVTDGTAQINQVVTDEGAEIKQKVQTIIDNLPSGTDPEVLTQLSELKDSVTNSFRNITSGVQNLSDNVSPPSGGNGGETPVP